jgi:hypothetical protein
MEQEDKFLLFPLLPKELRLQIWRHATRSHRRRIVFQYISEEDSFTHVCAPIPLLSVNHESRVETLKLYTKIEAGPTPASGTNFHAPLYIQPHYDMMRLGMYMDTVRYLRVCQGLEENGISATSLDMRLQPRLSDIGYVFLDGVWIHRPVGER